MRDGKGPLDIIATKESKRETIWRRALGALNRTKTPAMIYAGTANKNQVEKRRAKNKVARQSRKTNRGR